MANAFEIETAVADRKIETRIRNRQKSISDRELLIAAHLGNFTRVNELIESGANCNFKDKDGNTALFYAIESSANEDEKLQVAELLLRKNTIISLENADCETPLDLAHKSKARSIVALLETKLVENSFEALEKIIKQKPSSKGFTEEFWPDKKNESIREKVKQKVKVCLDALVDLVDNKEVKRFTYENANVFLLFLEAFALQDVEINADDKDTLIAFFGKDDNDVIKSVRAIFMHRDHKQREIIEPAYLQNIMNREENITNVSDFFCALKNYVQWIYDKFCDIQHNHSRNLPIKKSTIKSVSKKGKSLLDILHTLVKEAYSVEQDHEKQEQVLFNLVVNILPLLEADFKDGDLKTLKNLRNELVHNFHKYGYNLNIRLMELMSSLNELSSTLLAYYYAQRVFEVLESMKPGEDSKEIEKQIDVKLKELLDRNDDEGLVTFLAKAKNALGYKFSETVYLEKDDSDIKKLIDQYLKFMVIIDGTKIQKEDELDEKKDSKKKSYKLLSDVRRRHLFERFLMLRTIKDLDYKDYYKGKKEELFQELIDYGIASDTVNSVLEKYVENDKDFDSDELKNKVTAIIETLNSFSAKLPSVQDVISIYRSKEIDKINVDIRSKQEIKVKLDGLPKDQSITIQINEDEFRVRISEIVINMFKTFNYAYHKYKLKFTNEDAFNNKIFLEFLASKSIERNSSQGSQDLKYRDGDRVFISIKKLLKIGYSVPYIVRLLVKVNSSDLMEKVDLTELIQALLKKEGLYADHLRDLLSIENKREGINFYEIVCDEVIEKNLTFETMRSIFKTPKHVEGIVDELIKKAIQPDNRDKIAELAMEIVNITNSIACELYGIGKYVDALEILFDKKNLINSMLIEHEDINLLCAKYTEARIKNQQGILEENTDIIKNAFEILESLIKIKNISSKIEDHNKPYRFLFLAEKAHTLHLLKEYDQAYEACTDLYKEIRNYVLGLPVDFPGEGPLQDDEKEYRDITTSKKYQNLLIFSDEAQKYLDVVSIKSLQAYIKSEQEKYMEALLVFKEVYRYRKKVKDRYTIQSMRNIAFNSNKLGWDLYESNKDINKQEITIKVSQFYHEALLMHFKAYEMKNEISFSHTTNAKDLKNVILALFNIAKFTHYNGKKNIDLNYYEKAGGIYQKILAIQKDYFGHHHEYTLKAKHHFARYKNDDKCHEEALTVFYEVYESRKTELGEEHEDTLNSRKYIALTHNILGREKKSFDHLDIALEIYDSLRKSEWTYKDESQNSYDDTKRQFAFLKNDLSLHDEALKLFNEVYESRKINLGEEHESTLTVRKQIAFTHTKLGQVEESLEHFDKALGIYYSLSKKEWKDKDQCQKFYENTKRKIASLKNGLGLHEEALKLFNELYESRKTKLGEEHERTLGARKDTAFTHNKLGRAKSSPDHYDEALKIYDFLRKKDWKCKNKCQELYNETLKWRLELTIMRQNLLKVTKKMGQ